ncbi:MAG: FAD-binding oxidoreductase [Micromonosporaceae bacterium]
MRNLRGPVFRPGDPGYDRLTTGWNTRIRHTPALVVAAADAADVATAVRYAADHDLPVRAQATGHGALAAASDGLLIHTGDFTGVRVEPGRRTAEVVGGTHWQQLLDAADGHGLAGLSGSASFVGVIGYAIGGGAGWLARRYGLCADTIEAAELVTADGVRRWVDADHEPELWRAVRGGYSTAGIVTALRLRLVPVPRVYAGARSWPYAAAGDILPAYREWVVTAPREVTSAITFMQYPDAPQLPDALRGQTVIQFRACASEPADGPELLRPMTELPGAVLDTFRAMPYREIGTVTNDPERAMPRTGHSVAVSAVPDELAELARPGGPYLLFEARHVAGVVSESLPGFGAEFLVFTMAVTPDDASRAAAAELGTALQQATAGSVSGGNLPSFILAPPDPATAAETVRAAYPRKHAEWLRTVTAPHDPKRLLRGDRGLG